MFTDGDCPRITCCMHKYLDYILDRDSAKWIYQLMKGRSDDGTLELLTTARFAMMFRAFC